MTRTAFMKFAAAGVIAVVGVGVPTAMVMASDGDAVSASPADMARAARSAARATDNLDRGRIDQAVRYAEEAVGLAPLVAAHRSLLGQAYLAAGRFVSAEDSFEAAQTLGAVDSRTVIGDVLAKIANGKSSQAIDMLDAHAQTLPASDYGLALALAGQAERGALVLIDVVRADGSTARDRQNLALAYALAGRWLEARLIAAQDVGAANVGARMEQWAAMSQAGDARVRIAGLLGATPVEDPGMPVRLALRSDARPAVQLAQSDDPAPIAQFAPAAPQPTAEQAVDAMLADNAAQAAAVQTSAPQPAVTEVAAAAAPAGMRFTSEPVVQPLRGAAVAASTARRPAPAARPVRVAAAVAPSAPRAVPTGPVRTTGWAVQLGAYDSVGVARDAWSRLSRRHAQLSSRDAISTSATVRGTAFFRLAATGFDSRADANVVCASVRRNGSNCFVRQLDGRDTVRWASRETTTRVAAR